jgi:DNA-binding beta-propeller fold protein YncE
MDRRRFLLAAAAVPLSLGAASQARAGTADGGVGSTEPPESGDAGFAGVGAGIARAIALVTADLESRVAVVDVSTARVSAWIPTLGGPRSIENVDRLSALVAHTAIGRISLLDAVERRVRAVVGGFAAPRYTAGRGPVAYVTDSTLHEVVTVDVQSGRVLARADVPGPARHVTLTPDGEEIWTSLGSKARLVARLDARKARRPRLLRTFEPPFLAHDVVAAPDGIHVWVTSGDAHRFAVYERARREPVAVIAAGAPPQHIAFVGRFAFVASGDDGTVCVHRLNGDFVRQAQVPLGSYNVTFGGGAAVTPSLSRGTVAVLDGSGRVVAAHKIARAAHDACVVVD